MSVIWTRRRWMQTLVAGGAGLSLSRLAGATSHSAEPAPSRAEERHLELWNTHTGEKTRLVYKRGAEHDAFALRKLDHLLRDHRNGEVSPMDPRLYDQLFELARAADCEPRFEIISGYRSAESNNKMSARPGSGVAKKSLHMQGRAVDVRLQHCPCSTLRDLALLARQGGVGFYARSDFVHLDTGHFRTWAG